MKRLCVLAGLVGVLAVPAVQAAMQVTLNQDLSNYSYGVGGEFSALPNAALLSVNPTLAGYASTTAGSTAPYFQTFCIETGEEFSPGSAYNVTISDNILYDGGLFPSGEPITMGTAWLYSQFAAGILSGYDYTYGSGRTATAGDLQQTIWYLQGEETSLINGGADGTAFYNAAVSALGGNIANAANGAYGVVALNLWAPNEDGSNGAGAQDQLMVVPDSINLIPEPSAMSFGLLVLLPLGMYKVRALFRKQTV
ncbi:MAG: hypothetical protein ABSD77_09215 [Verrucomicrobiota bacterium]|jgi:hypothetical protein